MTLRPITAPYLICLNVKHYRDSRGATYFDRLWWQDLAQHLQYLDHLTLAAPCERRDPPPGTLAWTSSNLQIVDLPAPKSLFAAVAALPTTTWRLWRAIGRAEIVHLGVAGWPIPLGWIAAPLALARGKPIVIVIESAPWRLHDGAPRTWKNRIRAAVFETMAQWCVNRAAVVFVTQDEYRQSLLADPQRGHHIHASWVDEENVISDAAAEESWQRKRPSAATPLKLLFAGRLERAKGVQLLLEAMRILDGENVSVELSILGQGELFSDCEQAGASLQGAAKVEVCGSMPYDESFLRFVREYHAVVVPSLSDEQPRIVYDAYSQAVPVLAGDTAGLRDCVDDRKTGEIVDSNRAANWAALIRKYRDHPETLPQMGMTALQRARAMTHQEMHRRRWQILAARFAPSR